MRLRGSSTGVGLALLAHGQPGVGQGQGDEEDAGVELTRQEEADDARDDEHELHRVAVLAQERLPARHPWRDAATTSMAPISH
jgi:hypothetical protein